MERDVQIKEIKAVHFVVHNGLDKLVSHLGGLKNFKTIFLKKYEIFSFFLVKIKLQEKCFLQLTFISH